MSAMPAVMLSLALAALRLEGTVRDPFGAPVAGALVVVEAQGVRVQAHSDAQGRFGLDWAGPLPARVGADAPGLAGRGWAWSGEAAPLDLRLSPATFADAVTVTATRRHERVADVPAAVSVLDARALAVSAAPAVDEALRQVPGFALYRRSGSRTANPTSQGVTFRGLGGSATSRALVLDDGLPLNDAFGGWVQWGRVPLGALERVEVLRGGGSSLYGTGALAGVVQLVRRDEPGRRLDADLSLGSLDTRHGSLLAGQGDGPWRARLAAEGFDTGGYVAVRSAERGPVDAAVTSRHLSLDLTLERAGSGARRTFVRGTYYDDERENGTPLQDNDSAFWQAAAGLDHPLGGGALSARAHGGHQRFRQTFSAIEDRRLGERLTRTQEVPVDAGGLALQWTRALARHVLVAGAEARAVRGASEEEAVTPAGRTPSASGGTQRAGGVFLEDTWAPDDRWQVSLGGRFDAWRNFDAHQDGPGGSTLLPSRSESALSPRLAVRRRLGRSLALSASAYRAFRAPTLNELYRSFRVGNVVTGGNPLLQAERLRGAEASALLTPGPLSLRVSGFWMEVEDTVGNVTVSSTPALVTRQRQNLGRIRSRGLELEGELHPGTGWTLTGAFTLTGATVRAFSSDPTLVGRRLPQVPRQAGALGVRRDGRRFTLSTQARWSARQFEDDQNALPLAAAFNLDAFAAWAVSPRWQVYAAVENALDSEQEIGRTPVVTLAPPRSVRAGLRLRLGSAPGTGVAPH
jgi:outer membrane receptor protein involved in Fe transport